MNVSFKHISLCLAAASLFALDSCKNGDNEFSDYEYTAAFFATQTPVRTLVMGSDFDNDTELDNKHRCKIGATMGGSYKGRNATVDIAVDNSLCNDIYFDEAGTQPVQAMPDSYYTLSTNNVDFAASKSVKVNYNGDMTGYVYVQFTDAFFADKDAVKNTYVIPMKITSVSGIDKILEGSYDTETFSQMPALTNSSAWKVLPQNYTLYLVKYMSKYAGYYLRRGTDIINTNGKVIEVKREYKNEYKIEDEVVSVTTEGLNKVVLHVSYLIDNVPHDYNVVLTFDDSQNCTASSETDGITITGSGKYVDGGAGKYWGDRDRDQLTLSYTIDDGTNKISVEDILVMQRRGIKHEEFSYFYKSSK